MPFTIEIIERAPQLLTSFGRSITGGVSAKLSTQYLQQRERDSTSGNKQDMELRTGDLFRLRSVKFPEYELGITSKKIEGDGCYLGLHKAKAKQSGAEDDGNIWCHTTKFSARYNRGLFWNASQS